MNLHPRYANGQYMPYRIVAMRAFTVAMVLGVSLSVYRAPKAITEPHMVVAKPCIEVSKNTFDCTDEETKRKIAAVKWIDTPELPMAVLSRVCKKEGMGDDCPKILKAMSLQESAFGKKMVGDQGRSIGWFHILNIHKLSTECKMDLECSAQWTLKRMIRNGFASEDTKWKSVGDHNSKTPKYNKLYVAAVKSKLLSMK